MKRWVCLCLMVGFSLSSLAHAANWRWWSREPASAPAQPSSCKCPCGQVEVVAEFLLLRPHLCDLNYAIEDPRVFNQDNDFGEGKLPFGTEHLVRPSFQPSFRVGVGYVSEATCADIFVSYSGLWTSDHSRIAPGVGGYWPVEGHPLKSNHRYEGPAVLAGLSTSPIPFNAVAERRVKVAYNVVDVTAGMRSTQGCRLWMRTFFGLRWADICLRKKDRYLGTIIIDFPTEGQPLPTADNALIETRKKSESWGVGPRIGADVDYGIWCGLGVGARVGAGILSGESCHHVTGFYTLSPIQVGDQPPQEGSDEIIDVTRKSRVAFFPEFDMRLGLNYLWTCNDCFLVLAEIGWEFTTYINALGVINFDDAAGHDREVCESFGVSGLYVSCKIAF